MTTNRNRRNKYRARLGPKWWDRNDHVSFWNKWEPIWHTWGTDEFGIPFEWPKPCVVCVSEGGALT